VLAALALACFQRLVATPGGLIVDGRRPSVDHANPGEPRQVGNDLTFLFLPHHVSIARTISRFGHLPLWDARGFGGRPLVGNPQGGLFYPPVWTVWWSNSSAALGWLTIGHLLWGGIGVYVLMRSAAQGRLAATVAAAVYEASPYLLAHTFEGHYPHVWAACWYPWAFWCWAQIRSGLANDQPTSRGKAARAIGLLCLPIVLALTYLAGHPQEWLLLVVTLAVWVMVDAVIAWGVHGLRRAVRMLLIGVGVLVLSLGLAAVDVFPQLAVRPWLVHDGGPANDDSIPRRYHLELLNGFQLLDPMALGGPSTYFGSDNYWETVLSIGLVPLCLVVAAALRHPQRKLMLGWLVLVALAIWFACGRDLGLYTLLYKLVPGMRWFRVPARSLFLANLGAAMLAGLGIEGLHHVLGLAAARRRVGLRFALMLALVFAALCAIDRASEPASSARSVRAARRVIRDGGFPITVGALSAILAVGSLGVFARHHKLAVGLVGLLAMAELAFHGYSLVQVAPADLFLGADPVSETLARLRAERPSSGPLRIKARDAFYGDLPAVEHGFEKTNINDVFQLGHAARLYGTLYPVAARLRRAADQPMDRPVEEFNREVRQAVFDKMSVEYLLSDRVERDPGWPVAAQGSWNGRRFVIQRNPSALPRAYVVAHAAIAPRGVRFSPETFRGPGTPDSVLMDADPLSELPPEPRQPFITAEWISTDPDRPALTVQTDFPGLLVVTNTWMPGWRANVDGVSSTVLHGNHAQQVIPLPKPGEHTIALEYWPPGFSIGCAVTAASAVAWMIACGYVIVAGRKARRRLKPENARSTGIRGPAPLQALSAIGIRT
jgi:hypothetical protein